MIEYLKGKLAVKSPTYLVIETSGVAYYVNISLQTYSKLSDEESCKIYTHLAIKEDAHTLYGFFDQEERALFRQLISVSGVGASTARMILSSLNPQELQQAISTGNVALLQSIKGIGAKSAMRIIIDLKDKLKKEDLYSLVTSDNNTAKSEALSALMTLGFPRASVEKVIDRILRQDQNMPVEELIKTALKSM
ncbi:MAG: Holliday junction branch migration protein RuvA [Bacteroidia bacterium]